MRRTGRKMHPADGLHTRLILAMFLHAGCGSSAAPCGDVETDDAVLDDAGDPESDPVDEVPPPCPPPIAEVCTEDAPIMPRSFPELLRASDLAPGTRFVDVAFWSYGILVLAEREEASRYIVEIIVGTMPGMWDYAFETGASLELPPGSTLRAVAVTSPAHVLLCGRTECLLYSADSLTSGGVAELEPVPGGEVPAAGPMRGLQRAGGFICAYGDGIHCFDSGEWTTVVESGRGPPFNDMQRCDGTYVAVGDGGRIAVSAWPGWFDYLDETPRDLLTVACDGDRYFPAGEGGLVMDHDAGAECDVSDEDIFFLDAEGKYPYEDTIVGVTTSGRLFTGWKPLFPSSALCYTEQVLGPLVAADGEECGHYGFGFATADTVYGLIQCWLE